MDRIEITINQEDNDDEAMFVGVHINGNDMPGILNVEAFFAIKRDHELVPLFTCGCGIFECEGYYVDVSCTVTAFSWFQDNGETKHAEKDRLRYDTSRRRESSYGLLC
jgi:hypothetical protein